MTAAERIAREGGVAFREQFISETRGYLLNDTIGRTLFGVMSSFGPPQWPESDLEFMRSLVANCSPGAEMTLDRNIRYFDAGEDYYGQDDGEVSWRIPLGRVNWAYPDEIPIHHPFSQNSVEQSAETGSSVGSGLLRRCSQPHGCALLYNDRVANLIAE